MEIMYIYFSKEIPDLLPYTFFFLRRMYDGKIRFLTNEEFPEISLFEEYNVLRENVLDKYENIVFYNEYKILGIRDYATDDSVYMDIDIFFENPEILHVLEKKQNVFSHKYFNTLVISGSTFFKDNPPAPTFGSNGGIIKLDSPTRELYCKKSLEMFERIKPCVGKIPTIDAVAEELVASQIENITTLGHYKGSSWFHLMGYTPSDVKILQVYKENLINAQNK